MDDNTTPHRHGLLLNICNRAPLTLCHGQPASPHLNPIEYLWDSLARHVRSKDLSVPSQGVAENPYLEDKETDQKYG